MQFHSSSPLPAILTLFGAMLCFDAMSVLVRLLQPDYSAMELSAYRNVLGALPSIVLMLWTGELRLRGTSLRIRQWRLALMRGLIIAVAQLLFYSALGRMELATVSALGQTNAIFVVILSVFILRNRVGVWRWGAVFLGFGGAMLILQPGSDAFSIWSLLPIGAALCYALSMVALRLFDTEVSNALLYLYSSLAAAVGAIVFAVATTDFTPIASAMDGALIFSMGMLGGIGVLLLMLAYRMAEPAMLAPFSYFGILTAFALGWMFFDEAPIDTLFPGVFLIVAAGAIILWRENRRPKAKAPVGPATMPHDPR